MSYLESGYSDKIDTTRGRGFRRMLKKAGLGSSSRHDLPASPSSPNRLPEPPSTSGIDALYDLPQSIYSRSDYGGVYERTRFTSKVPSTPGSRESAYSRVSPEANPSFGDSSVRCSICEMPLSYKLSNEPTIVLDCGHSVHMECNINLSLGEAHPEGKNTSYCGICDKNTRPASHDYTEVPVIDNLTGVEAPATPTARIVNFDHLLTPPSTGSSFSAHNDALIKNCLNPSRDFNDHPPFELFAVPERTRVEPSQRKVTFSVGISVPEIDEISYDFRCSAADINVARAFAEELSELEFRGKPLGSLPMGKLRLTDFLYVSSSESLWKRSYVYLLTNMLVVCRTDNDGQKVVKSTVRVDDIQQVRIKLVNGYNVLCLLTSNPHFGELYLGADDTEILHKWQLAFYNPDYEFPVAPRLLDNSGYSYCNLDLSPPIPLDLILCVSMLDLEDTIKARTILQAIHRIKSRMGCFDKLGIVFFGPGTLKAIPPKRRSWKKWDMITDELSSATRCRPSKEPFDYNKLLICCESLLKNHQASLSMASIIIVSDLEQSTLSYLPWTFVKAGTPINTITTSPGSTIPLSVISGRTGGRFKLLSGLEALGQVLEVMVNTERKHCQKQCKLILRPSEGFQITDILGWKRGPDEHCFGVAFPKGPLSPSTEGPVQLAPDGFEINLGHVRYGECRSILVVLETVHSTGFQPDCMANVFKVVASSQDVLCLDTHILHTTAGDALVEVCSSTDEEPPSEIESVYQSICNQVFESLERTLFMLKEANIRQAFEMVSAIWQRLDCKLPELGCNHSASRELKASIAVINQRLDMWCNDIINPMHDTSALIASIVDSMWSLASNEAIL